MSTNIGLLLQYGKLKRRSCAEKRHGREWRKEGTTQENRENRSFFFHQFRRFPTATFVFSHTGRVYPLNGTGRIKIGWRLNIVVQDGKWTFGGGALTKTFFYPSKIVPLAVFVYYDFLVNKIVCSYPCEISILQHRNIYIYIQQFNKCHKFNHSDFTHFNNRSKTIYLLGKIIVFAKRDV